MATLTNLPLIEDSFSFVRGNYNLIYPQDESRRKTIGNIPERLHTEINDMCKSTNLRMFEVIAGLWDFYKEYEAEYEAELTAQRLTHEPKR